MKQRKFIITLEGRLRLGMVWQHRELLQHSDQCIGGGYYRIDYVANRIVLDRFSYDFGKPRWHLVDVLKVPAAYRGMKIVYQQDDGEVLCLSDTLPLAYEP